MAVATSEIFKKCSSALRTNIDTCGSVSVCSATVATTPDELDEVFKDGSTYRILESLFMTQFEMKMCGAIQNSWEDFFMANLKTPKRGEIQLHDNDRSLFRIRPYLLAKQKRPINNVYWRFDNGQAADANWQIDVYSLSGIPADIRSFGVNERVYVESRNSSAKNFWNGLIVSRALVTVGGIEKVRMIVTPQNAGTAQDALANPVAGILRRGPANVAKVEAYCDSEPAYRNDIRSEYWMEHDKYTFCVTKDFAEFRKFAMANNPLYAELVDIPEVEEHAQRTKAFQSKMFNNLMFGRQISANQTRNLFTELEQVNYFTSATGLGFPGVDGVCSGFKANTVGWFEQLQQCGRVYDAVGATLNLWSLMDAIYAMSRVRQGINSAAAGSFDLFTDSSTAELIDRAFIKLYKEVSEDTLRLTEDIQRGRNEAFGFQFSKYRLRGKTQGITLNVITHYGLDDYLAEWSAFEDSGLDGNANASDSGRVLWMLDMTGMYAKIIESENSTSTSGKLEDLQRIDPSFQCVQATTERTVTQRGVLYAAVLECGEADLVIENFSGEIPEITLADRPSYLPGTAQLYSDLY